MNNIDINDFAKIYLLVGEIISCQEVEGSNKLYKLEVDLGEVGKRQILAGVRKFFSPEELVGKQGVYVANLEPRKILDLESQGMMLFSKDANGNMAMITVSKTIDNGTRVS